VFKKLVLSLTKNILFNRKISFFKMLGDLLSKKRRPYLLDRLHGGVLRDITKAGDKLIAQFDTERYAPFLHRMTKTVRDVTENGIVMFEHTYYGNIGVPLRIPPIEIDGAREKKQCYSPHAYDFMVDTPAYKYANNSRVESFFESSRQAQERLDVPVLVGEWGGGGDETEWFPHVRFLLDLFDSYQWSQAYYCYDCMGSPLKKELCRPHPVAVTGKIDAYSFDREAGVFLLEYTQTEPAAVQTELYAHKPIVAVESDGAVTKPASGGPGIVKIKTDPGKHRVVLRF
jgi:endoglycosylceramidase